VFNKSKLQPGLNTTIAIVYQLPERNNMKHSIPVFIAVMLLGYLLGSFVVWDYNPGNWDFGIRVAAVTLSTFFAAGISMANHR